MILNFLPKYHRKRRASLRKLKRLLSRSYLDEYRKIPELGSVNKNTNMDWKSFNNGECSWDGNYKSPDVDCYSDVKNNVHTKFYIIMRS